MDYKLVGHYLKVGTYHWIPHWKCTVNCPSISVLVGQILKLVRKWPMADCYFKLCIWIVEVLKMNIVRACDSVIYEIPILTVVLSK